MARDDDELPEEPIEEMPAEAEDGALEDVPALETETSADAVETPTLSAKEIEQLKKQARKEVEQEYKRKLKAKLLAEEKDKQRDQLSMADNANLNGHNSDLVRITIDIPEFSNAPWIQINQPTGPCYIHGQTYVVKRHIGNQLRESMQMMRRHQNEIDGKKRNRQLPDGTFVDVVTGRRSATRDNAQAINAGAAA